MLQLVPADAAKKRRFLQACQSLDGNPDFDFIVGCFRNLQKELDASARRHKEEIVIRWSQGQGQLCEEFLDSVENAGDKLRAMN